MKSFAAAFASWILCLIVSRLSGHVTYATPNFLRQEPITRSVHTNCTLDSTPSRIFLVLELSYVWGGSLISCKNMQTFA